MEYWLWLSDIGYWLLADGDWLKGRNGRRQAVAAGIRNVGVGGQRAEFDGAEEIGPDWEGRRWRGLIWSTGLGWLRNQGQLIW